MEGADPRDDASVIISSFDRPDQFAVIFQRHSSAVFKFLARQFGRDVAADLMAETFATAFRTRLRYDTSRANSRPWLLGIATNLGHHESRSQARLRRMLQRLGRRRDAPPLDETERSDRLVDAVRDHTHLEAALRQLSPSYREVILLFAGLEMSYEDIAEALGIPVGTVRSRLSRGRSDLRELLGPSGQDQQRGNVAQGRRLRETVGDG